MSDWPRYTQERATIVRPTRRWGRWQVVFTTEGPGALPLETRTSTGYPSAWTQRGAERKAARQLRRLRSQRPAYDVWLEAQP